MMVVFNKLAIVRRVQDGCLLAGERLQTMKSKAFRAQKNSCFSCESAFGVISCQGTIANAVGEAA